MGVDWKEFFFEGGGLYSRYGDSLTSVWNFVVSCLQYIFFLSSSSKLITFVCFLFRGLSDEVVSNAR